jgi:hypothetical protein
VNQFFRIGLAMAITVCMIACVQGGKAGKAAGAAFALKVAQIGNSDQQQSTNPQTVTPTTAAPTSAAPSALASGPTGIAAVPLTKMQIIIKNVTSCKYPYRCSVFAGDYCQRQCTVICAPPL